MGAINVPLTILMSTPDDTWNKIKYYEFSLSPQNGPPASGLAGEKYIMLEKHGTLKDIRNIFVLCDTGIDGSKATRKLIQSGYNAKNIEGGLDIWVRSGQISCGTVACLFNTPAGTTDKNLPRVDFPVLDQYAIVIASFGFKPIYEILALLIVIILWRSSSPDLMAVRRGLIAFFIGENACSVNYLFFNEMSLFVEYIHSFGMLVCFGLMNYALMEAMDSRIIKFTIRDDKCAMLSLCRKCYKYVDTACNLRILFLFTIPAAGIIAFMPLTGEIASNLQVGPIFGNDVVLGHPIMYQLFETRLCPLVGLLFLIPAWFVIVFRKENGISLSKVLFSMALGPIGFAMMRFTIYWSYQHNPLWADFWEEITEMMFICGILLILYMFRKALFEKNMGGDNKIISNVARPAEQ